MQYMLLLVVLFSCPACPNEASILHHCPIQGDTQVTKVKELNKLKRRMTIPSAKEIDPKATLQALLAPGDDTRRWDESRGAVLEGYVAGVKEGGIESVNCHTHEVLYRDTHIELTIDPKKNNGSDLVIVEVTPQFREVMAADGVDWTTGTLHKTLIGHRVRITGWLFFDAEHKANARNTATSHGNVWRATVWEIHPITAIQILLDQPIDLGEAANENVSVALE